MSDEMITAAKKTDTAPPHVPKCHFEVVENGRSCEKAGTERLRASWFYYPDGDWDVPLCAEHRAAVLKMSCDRWLHDSRHERGERSDDRSGPCLNPAVGLICWDCEGSHDYDCEEINCPGYSLVPACESCLAHPNDNDIDRGDEE